MSSARAWRWMLAASAIVACSERSAAPSEPIVSAVVLSDPWLANGGSPIPGNGGLLFGHEWGEVSVEVAPLASPEAKVAGAVRHKLGRFWVWTADETMPEGSYSVRVFDARSTDLESDGTFEVVGPRAFGPPALTTSPSVSIIEVPSASTCCWDWVWGRRETRGCFDSEMVDRVELRTGLRIDEDDTALGQLLSYVAPITDEFFYEEVSPFGRSRDRFSFGTQADEYCFGASITEIATGERHTFDDLATCAAHGELPVLGRRTLEVTDADLDRLRCAAPPEGLEDRWCALNERACPTNDGAGCQLAGHVCRGEPLPVFVPPVMESGGSAGASGEAVTGGAGGGSGTGTRGPISRGHESQNTCAAARAGARASHGFEAWSAALWLVLAGRPRRARAKCSA
jgi:hypothetical protein